MFVMEGTNKHHPAGASYCQLMDILFPETVPLHKVCIHFHSLVAFSIYWEVNFGAKFDQEYIKNWKILQTIFAKVGVNKVSFSNRIYLLICFTIKVFDVNKLVKGQFQDNLGE